VRQYHRNLLIVNKFLVPAWGLLEEIICDGSVANDPAEHLPGSSENLRSLTKHQLVKAWAGNQAKMLHSLTPTAIDCREGVWSLADSD
jgi:hypothetical protein